jgi:hypothetical protein
MARDSLGRMVARAARTGGRRPGTGPAIERFHLVLAAIVVLGSLLVWYSRYEAENPVGASSTPPTTKQTWLTAITFDVCGNRQPNLPANPNLNGSGAKGGAKGGSGGVKLGLYTEGDGIIHIHPLSAADAGDNATLGRFVSDYPGLTLTSTSLRLPHGPLYRNGDSCGSRPGTVQVVYWPNTLPTTKAVHWKGSPTSLKLPNDGLVTVAFVPKGETVLRPTSTQVSTLLNSSVSSTTTTAAPSTPAPSTPAPSTQPSTAASVNVPPSTTAKAP